MGCYVMLTLLFFGCSFSSCSHFPPRKYYYINQRVNWSVAQSYCREHYTDLATFESNDDVSMLEPHALAWIGLWDDPNSWKVNLGNDPNSWRWSVTGETGKTTFTAWASGEPSNWRDPKVCVHMSSSGTWKNTDCSTKLAFMCFTVKNHNEVVYNFIPGVRSWNSAQQYCRQYHTDLAMIKNAEENAEAFSVTGGQTCWIGLYRMPWTWSDMSPSSYRNWHYSQPNENLDIEEHCVAEEYDHLWGDMPCHFELPFICHQVTRLKTTVRMRIKTDANLTDPAIIEQILQQVGARLTDLGWNDFKLQWENLLSNQTEI